MSEEVNVRTIVAEWLKQHGYDGLVSDVGCGCALDDLMPCGEFSGECLPAYRWTCPCDLCGLDGGELCPDPDGDCDDGCYRTEKQL